MDPRQVDQCFSLLISFHYSLLCALQGQPGPDGPPGFPGTDGVYGADVGFIYEMIILFIYQFLVINNLMPSNPFVILLLHCSYCITKRYKE